MGQTSDIEPSPKHGHTKYHKKKKKKKSVLIPKPYSSAGKKGDGMHGSKGFNLQKHMGLDGKDSKYLNIGVC